MAWLIRAFWTWAGVNAKLTHFFLPNSSVWSFDQGDVGSSDWP